MPPPGPVPGTGRCCISLTMPGSESPNWSASPSTTSGCRSWTRCGSPAREGGPASCRSGGKRLPRSGPWLAIRPEAPDRHMFLNAMGRGMTRRGFAKRLALHVATAARTEPSIARRKVTPHVLRHACALTILNATGDIRKVSLWLGHQSLQTTEIYLRTDPRREAGHYRGVAFAGSRQRTLRGREGRADGDARRTSELECLCEPDQRNRPVITGSWESRFP